MSLFFATDQKENNNGVVNSDLPVPYIIAAAESLMRDYCDYVLDTYRKESIPSNQNSTNSNVQTLFNQLNYDGDDDLLLTTKQRMLKLPIELVFAAVISDQATTEFGTSRQIQRNAIFQRLQLSWSKEISIFFNTKKVKQGLKQRPQRSFEWSPTLILQCTDDECGNKRKKLTSIISTEIYKRCKALIEQVEDASNQLLDAEVKFTKHSKVRNAECRLRSQQHQPDSVTDISNEDSDSDDEIRSTSHVDHEKMLSNIRIDDECQENYQIVNNKYEPCEDSSPFDDKWITVHKNHKIHCTSTQSSFKSSGLETDIDSQPLRSSNTLKSSTVMSNTEHITVHSFHDDGIDDLGVLSLDEIPAQSIVPDTPAMSLDPPANIPQQALKHNLTIDVDFEPADAMDLNSFTGKSDLQTTTQSLVEKIKSLEHQLKIKEQQLLNERKMAQKSLQSEKDTLVERIQAIQLRLYISETRLQTYEEALQQHIQSVTQNTASTSSPGRLCKATSQSETPPLYERR